jgi:hypothetical protein
VVFVFVKNVPQIVGTIKEKLIELAVVINIRTNIMRVISFCLWGNGAKYNVGAIRNAELAREIYPGWICRFHVANTSVNLPPAIAALKQMDNVEIAYLDNYRSDWGLMLSRLNPGQDDSVEVLISRDCDSRLSLREKEAVDAWLASGKLMHSMHDHPYHSVPILGGMFGVVCRNLFAAELPQWAHKWFIDHEERWQVDQDFLTKEVYPIAKDDIMNHDQFFRHLWGGVPFPSPRRGLEFVGQVFDENECTVSEHQAILAKYEMRNV